MRFLEVPNIETALEMVVNNFIDCALFEKLAFNKAKALLIESGKFNPETDTQPVVKAKIAKENAYLAYSSKAFESELYPYSKDFKRAFDMALFQLQQAGEVEALVESHGGLDIR